MFKTYFDTLKTILEDNKNTEYGKKYNFSQIKSLEDYKNNVPISNYNHFKPFIERMCRGEENILTSYPIYDFICTSGTEGPQKLFPMTRKALDIYCDIPIRNYTKIFQKYREQNGKGKRLLLGLFHIDLNKKLDRKLFISECIYYYNLMNGVLDVDKYLGGRDLLFDPYTEDFMYEKIWLAILEENVILIESIYMYEVLQFFNTFEKNYKEIISDIRKGVIDPKRKLSENAKNFLLNMKYSEERLNFVEKECEKGFEGIASRIWKNLKLVTGITSRIFEFQNKALEKYIGDIPKDGFAYALSRNDWNYIRKQ